MTCGAMGMLCMGCSRKGCRFVCLWAVAKTHVALLFSGKFCEQGCLHHSVPLRTEGGVAIRWAAVVRARIPAGGSEADCRRGRPDKHA